VREEEKRIDVKKQRERDRKEIWRDRNREEERN
jgi:hypothetical protein